MSSYSISPKLKSNRVFILQKNELQKCFDPVFYVPEKELLKKASKEIEKILLKERSNRLDTHAPDQGDASSG